MALNCWEVIGVSDVEWLKPNFIVYKVRKPYDAHIVSYFQGRWGFDIAYVGGIKDFIKRYLLPKPCKHSVLHKLAYMLRYAITCIKCIKLFIHFKRYIALHGLENNIILLISKNIGVRVVELRDNYLWVNVSRQQGKFQASRIHLCIMHGMNELVVELRK